MAFRGTTMADEEDEKHKGNGVVTMSDLFVKDDKGVLQLQRRRYACSFDPVTRRILPHSQDVKPPEQSIRILPDQGVKHLNKMFGPPPHRDGPRPPVSDALYAAWIFSSTLMNA